MVVISEKVGDIIAPIARDLAEFEQKVLDLERKCAEFRRGVQGLAQDLRDASARFSPTGEAAETETSGAEVDPPAGGADASAPELAKMAGVSSRVEVTASIMVVRRPGGSVLPVGCGLSRELCVRGFKGQEKTGAEELRSEIRRHLSLLSTPEFRETFGKPVDGVVLYIPCDARRSAFFDRLPGLREEASAAGVVLAPPAALFAILRNVAGAWLRFSCSGNVRSLVDKGQDLVDDLSAFISFFTDNEKALCEAVESYARESRAAIT
ncbi:MAG TPA: DNA recombination protein RmuC [Spirochaetia bacterium]|nr:DNA recombination protein RmuC [Spirochaetia bacterium]